MVDLIPHPSDENQFQPTNQERVAATLSLDCTFSS
jgi:hypothetical protein